MHPSSLDERAPRDAVVQQAVHLQDVPEVWRLLNAVPGLLLILNQHRQIVFANRSVLEMIGATSMDSVYGLRPGEALDCPNAALSGGGCGTAEACSTCGAANAIRACERGSSSIQECRIVQKGSGKALDFRVSTMPFDTAVGRFTIMGLADISHEKRRQALERIFFHDLLNTANAVVGYAELLRRAPTEEVEDLTGSILRLAGTLVEEIRAQRALVAAESNDLIVHPDNVHTLTILGDVAEIYRNHEASSGRNLVIDVHSLDVTFRSDRGLLTRVISNMVKNGLEASGLGQTVRMGCRLTDDKSQVEFWVHNQAAMSRDVQLQVFQRSFSTKGVGRGLGTYSIKLLTERYLNGSVDFVTSAEHGTTFRARYPRTSGESARGVLLR